MTEANKGVLSVRTIPGKGREESDLAEYNESSYPAKAESDEEVDLDVVPTRVIQNITHQTSRATSQVEEESAAVRDDISCVVCAEVLVDPCTLHCGHSFCQLCLASIWKNKTLPSPANLHCPVCRQPWGSYPGVNIQLRQVRAMMACIRQSIDGVHHLAIRERESYC